MYDIEIVRFRVFAHNHIWAFPKYVKEEQIAKLYASELLVMKYRYIYIYNYMYNRRLHFEF